MKKENSIILINQKKVRRYWDADIAVLEKKLEKYKMIKQGMMQNLLTWKIRLI